jgi:hypothetical protein
MPSDGVRFERCWFRQVEKETQSFSNVSRPRALCRLEALAGYLWFICLNVSQFGR